MVPTCEGMSVNKYCTRFGIIGGINSVLKKISERIALEKCRSFLFIQSD